jgi:hypothetical protein
MNLRPSRARLQITSSPPSRQVPGGSRVYFEGKDPRHIPELLPGRIPARRRIPRSPRTRGGRSPRPEVTLAVEGGSSSLGIGKPPGRGERSQVAGIGVESVQGSIRPSPCPDFGEDEVESLHVISLCGFHRSKRSDEASPGAHRRRLPARGGSCACTSDRPMMPLASSCLAMKEFGVATPGSSEKLRGRSPETHLTTGLWMIASRTSHLQASTTSVSTLPAAPRHPGRRHGA